MNFLYKHQALLRDWIWDIETYPNIFTAAFLYPRSQHKVFFEISTRRNDIIQMIEFVQWCRVHQQRFIGFNSVAFDYPVLHHILEVGSTVSVREIYEKAQSIIDAPYNQRFRHIIRDEVVQQVDLFKIHHFDNQAKATSLKTLEINMGRDRVEDLPFPPGTVLDDQQMDVLVHYNYDDVYATEQFYYESIPLINFRQELSEKYDKNFINHNDTKIGKDYFIMELEKAMPGSCYDLSSGKREIRQTKRDSIALADVILPYVQFEHPEFQRVLDWFNSQVITQTKGAIHDVNCNIDGFQFDFGTGGIHGSIDASIVNSDEEGKLWDWDVASYYPNLAIANRFYPEHLSEKFCDIYKDVFMQRRQYKKGTPENAMLKLALNGVYGDSNSKYSPFYDPKYTMSITINGQLLLCVLAEQLMKIPGLKMVQINTDGLTVKCPHDYEQHMKDVCKWWEQLTNLELESAVYTNMYIRDVNNYIAVYEPEDGKACPCGCGKMSGKIKRKGKYCYGDDLALHQNHSEQVVAKAAEAALIHGTDVTEFIYNHSNTRDFMLGTKVPRASKLALQVDGEDVIVPNVVRYVVSTNGYPMNKVMPAAGPEGQYKRANGLTDDYYHSVLNEIGYGVWDARIHTKNKSKFETRRIGINTGYKVTVCNNIQILQHVSINYDYYITQANKLVLPLLEK